VWPWLPVVGRARGYQILYCNVLSTTLPWEKIDRKKKKTLLMPFGYSISKSRKKEAKGN